VEWLTCQIEASASVTRLRAQLSRDQARHRDPPMMPPQLARAKRSKRSTPSPIAETLRVTDKRPQFYFRYLGWTHRLRQRCSPLDRAMNEALWCEPLGKRRDPGFEWRNARFEAQKKSSSRWQFRRAAQTRQDYRDQTAWLGVGDGVSGLVAAVSVPLGGCASD
jgi:hypothetical protein